MKKEVRRIIEEVARGVLIKRQMFGATINVCAFCMRDPHKHRKECLTTIARRILDERGYAGKSNVFEWHGHCLECGKFKPAEEFDGFPYHSGDGPYCIDCLDKILDEEK